MRVALAARVSTRDKHQDPEVQVVPLREFAAARGWDAMGEYVDWASASTSPAGPSGGGWGTMFAVVASIV